MSASPVPQQRKKGCITAGQFFVMAFASTAVTDIISNTNYFGAASFTDVLLCVGASFVLVFAAALPLYFLLRRFPGENILQISARMLGKYSVVVGALYYINFFAICASFLSSFQLFMENTMNPVAPVWVICACVTAVAAYGAAKGLETVARAAGYMAVGILLAFLFIFIALLPEIRLQYLEPPFYSSSPQA